MVNAIRLLAYTLLSYLLELLKGLSCTLEEARERLDQDIGIADVIKTKTIDGSNISNVGIFLLFVLGSLQGQWEPTTIHPDHGDLDIDDVSPNTEVQTDINLSSDEAGDEEHDMDGCSEDAGKEAEFGEDIVQLKDMDSCSDDEGNEAEVGKDSSLKGLLQAVLMLFLPLITKGNMHRRRDTTNSLWNGTVPRRESWKELLRSLHDPCWLAGCCSHYQQVGAVPFTQFDEAIDWLINLIRRITIPIQETDPGDGFVSLPDTRGLRRLASCTIPIEETGHVEGFLSLANGRGLRHLASCTIPIQETGHGEGLVSLAQPDIPLANSVALVGSEPTPTNSCASVGSVSGDVGATTPGQVDADTLHIPDLSELEEENERLRRQRDCIICLVKTRDVRFTPCNHLVCCKDCSERFTGCPVCRRHIAEKVAVPEG